MSQHVDLPHAAETRQVSVRARRDLQVERQRVQGRPVWTVKDPVSLRYHQLTDEEYTVLRMLDGSVSLDDIKRELEDRYPPRVATHAEVQWLLQLFHRRGLVFADVRGQGEELWRRRRHYSRGRWLASLSNPLFIRLPGVDPDRFLGWLHVRLGWIYRPWCLLGYVLLVASALLLIIVQTDAVYAKLPSFYQFFAAGNLIWLMVALAVSKALHELAHGLTCKHFGGECHEIGLALLVFTPCLYCDTSDSWMLPNRWHRVAIGAAGMAMEIILAAFCTFLWWFSHDGLLHYLCLNVMFVCSVSTIVFNGNPLLRYDGYYILSDLLEIPNLSQRARTALIGVFRWWCLGLSWASDIILPDRRRTAFALYAVASTLYRWVVLFSILWFLTHALQPYGLQALGQAATVMALVGLFISPMLGIGRLLATPGSFRQMKPLRLVGSAIVFLLLCAFVLFVPWPHHVMTTVIVQPRDATRIYVESSGTLDQVYVQPGTHIEPKEALARLTNPDVVLEVTSLTGQRDRLAVHLKNLRRRQGRDLDAAEQIPHTEAALADLTDRLQSRMKDKARLTLRSPVAGVVLPPPLLPRPQTDEASLPGWWGLPFDSENLGCFLESGTLYCLVGDPREMEAVLVIDQSDVQFVREGAVVEIRLDEYPHKTLRGQVQQLARVDMRIAPRALSHKTGGGVETVTDPLGAERTLSVSYQALVKLDDFDGVLMPGFRGRAKIHAPRQTVAARAWRLANETFRFQ